METHIYNLLKKAAAACFNFAPLVLLILPLVLLTGCGGDDDKRPTPVADADAAPVEPAPSGDAATPVGDGAPAASDTAPEPGDAGTPDVPAAAVNPADAGPALPAATPGASAADVRKHLQSLAEPLPEGGFAINDKALTAIEKAGPESIELVRPFMADKDPQVRLGAAFYLVDLFDANDTATVKAFSTALTDESGAVRQIALQAIQRMPAATQATAAPQLAKLLLDHNSKPASRSAIARAIGKLGADAAPVLPQLLEAGKTDPDHRTRVAAIYAASRVGTPQQAVDVYRTVLKESDSPVVVRAALARLDVLPGGESAAVEVAATLGFKDPAVARLAMKPLTRWGQPAVAPLTQLLSSGGAQAKQLALATLAQLGRLAKPAQPAVAKLVSDPDPAVKKAATQLLASLEKISP